LRHEKEFEQELILETESDKAVPSDSDSDIDNGHNEYAATVGCDSNSIGTEVCIWLRPQNIWNFDGVPPFTGDHCGLRIQETPYVNKDSTPVAK